MQVSSTQNTRRDASGEFRAQPPAVFGRWNDLLGRHAAATAAVLALIVFGVFRGVLVNGFVMDDVPFILGNPFVSNPHFWKEIFTGSL